MSGHSKWATIKRQKAVTDAKKGVVYAKIAREIIVAVKSAGSDPAANVRLRQALERAKAEGVPSDNIARAIEKGTGSSTANNLEELTYEGYGPGGVAILVHSTTDNRNRTAADLRSYFSKHGGNLGETGCVGWMFQEVGEIEVKRNANSNEDRLIETVLELGATDVNCDQPEVIEIVCSPLKLESIRSGLTTAGFEIVGASTKMVPLTTIEITELIYARSLIKLLDALENHDDVQQVYTNFDLDDALLKQCWS